MNDDYEYDVKGAPVVYSNIAPQPYNPLRRPEISFVKPIITLVAYIIFNVALIFASDYLKSYFAGQELLQKAVVIGLPILLNIIFLAVIAKRALIWLIHVYQHYASDEVRLKCVFEPSCSEYMIAAVQKYGVIRGVIKGTDRLLRCHPPNGGKDEP